MLRKRGVFMKRLVLRLTAGGQNGGGGKVVDWLEPLPGGQTDDFQRAEHIDRLELRIRGDMC
jgi:hypothetical protein